MQTVELVPASKEPLQLTDHQINLIKYFGSRGEKDFSKYTREEMIAFYDDYIKEQEELFPTPEELEFKKVFDKNYYASLAALPELIRNFEPYLQSKALVEKTRKVRAKYEQLEQLFFNEESIIDNLEHYNGKGTIKGINASYPFICFYLNIIFSNWDLRFWEFAQKQESDEAFWKIKGVIPKAKAGEHSRMNLPIYPMDKLIRMIFVAVNYILSNHPKTKKYIAPRFYYARGDGRTKGNMFFPGSYVVYAGDEDTPLLMGNSVRIFYSLEELRGLPNHRTGQSVFDPKNYEAIDYLIYLCIHGLLKDEYNQGTAQYKEAKAACIDLIRERLGRDMYYLPDNPCVKKDMYQWPKTYIMKCDTCGKILENCHENPSVKWKYVNYFCKKEEEGKDRLQNQEYLKYCKHKDCKAEEPGHLITEIIQDTKNIPNPFA